MIQETIQSQKDIENRIFTIRDIQVMLDRDLAEMYGVETKRINEQVSRNIERFPETFRFQLSNTEKNELVANCDRFKTLKHSTVLPYAFTEQGVAMLSAVLKSNIAVKVSIQIINAFVEMRKILRENSGILQRLDRFELRIAGHDHQFEKVFKALEQNKLNLVQGIFFNGQLFDAYTFAADIIRSAKKEIILIDNYVDDTVLTMLHKRNKNVKAFVYTGQVSKQLQLDLDKYNQQYEPIIVQILKDTHDRFLIIDEKELYHLGASLKDLGKKWFAFSKMNGFVPIVLKHLDQK